MSKFRNLTAVAAVLALGASLGVVSATAQQGKPAAPSAPKAAAPTAASAAVKAIPLGRPALPEEIAAWDIDVRPDGLGLPKGKGSVKEGEELYLAQCAVCHGEFGEGAGRYPVLVGGRGSLTGPAPEKTIGSFWPYASTAYDYIHRAMPFGNAQSLTPDQTYAIVAFLLNQNEVVKDDFVLSNENFASVKLPNVDAFYDDDREKSEKAFWREPCMTNCAKEPAKVVNRARTLDVTPDGKGGSGVE